MWYSTKKVFTDGIGTRCVIRGFEEFDGACRGYLRESWSEFAIVIMNEHWDNFPYGVAFRNCCATQASVGDRVTPTWITFRDFSEGVEESEARTEEEISNVQVVLLC